MILVVVLATFSEETSKPLEVVVLEELELDVGFVVLRYLDDTYASVPL